MPAGIPLPPPLNRFCRAPWTYPIARTVFLFCFWLVALDLRPALRCSRKKLPGAVTYFRAPDVMSITCLQTRFRSAHGHNESPAQTLPVGLLVAHRRSVSKGKNRDSTHADSSGR